MKFEPMPSPKYKYNYFYKDGTFYQGDVPPYEDTWTDIPVFHVLWSWQYTAKRVLKEYVAEVRKLW